MQQSTQPAPGGVLSYLVYGGTPRFVSEAKFSILSALRWLRPDSGSIQIVVVTDSATDFAGWPVTCHPIEAETLRSWVGRGGYIHRCKAMALDVLLQTYELPTLLVDSDTLFLADPARLIRQVVPGHSVMHVSEGPVFLGWRFSELAKIMRSRGIRTGIDLPSSRRWEFKRWVSMWNSGVIGVHPLQRNVLADVIELIDAFYAATESRITEQFAFTEVLRRHTRLRAAARFIDHYWHCGRFPRWHAGRTRRELMDAQVSAFFEYCGQMTPAEQLKEFQSWNLQTYQVPVSVRVRALLSR